MNAFSKAADAIAAVKDLLPKLKRARAEAAQRTSFNFSGRAQVYICGKGMVRVIDAANHKEIGFSERVADAIVKAKQLERQQALLQAAP